MPRLVVFGEALTDFVRSGAQSWHSVAGGSCWNVARVAATLGVASAWGGAVSDDLFGRDIIALSRDAGLDLRFAQVVAKPPLIAMVHQTHPPQYFFLGSDTADLAFDESRLPAGWDAHCEFAHFGCISLVRQPLGARLLAMAERLKARGVRISFDPNYRNLMGADYPALFERLATIADIIKISDEDMGQIYPQLAADAALAHVRALAPDAMLLYTRGADGLTLYRHEQIIEQGAFKVEVADTVGAGDSCIGGFIASLLSAPQASHAEHLRFAAATAAVVCAHAGAYSPSRGEVELLLAGG
ncbi:carbohydrate kinase family protein [Hydrocarboniphaga sp.]|uniref:carbohydrate kinase family protein n=1 Tax=Hydrocarboniphaga sp. TaxID=2033016 RepID=UPI003D0F5C75